MIKKLTNRTDLDKCCAQIELVKGLITIPEDLDKLLEKLETKKELLMKHRTNDYITILKEFYPGKEIKIPEVKEDISLEEVEDGREMLKQANNALAEKEKELKVQALEKEKIEKAKKAAEAKLKKEREAKKILATKKASKIKKLEAELREARKIEKEDEAEITEEVIEEIGE